ncbi:MAG: M48 family metallopeptidase [Bacteroidales bacterium]|jgi:STE24 endopeptidase|nr:M48 family metallopeptidase [Bacteroidales bacterium]
MIFWIIITVLTFDFILEQTLGYLNTTRWSDTLPDEVKGIYDAEKYRKQQAYSRTNYRFGTLVSCYGFVIIMLMFAFCGFAVVNQWAEYITQNPIWTALLFFGILLLASDLLNMPFELYDTFVIEERFGFNRTTPRTFILDKLKGWALSAVIGGGLLALLIWLYGKTGPMFWLIAWATVTAFTLFMAMFYSSLIVPLFNRQTPLEDGPLKEAIRKFADSVDFKLENIFVIDGSKRSTKANAYFTGLGRKKRIVLYDTLVQDMTVPEIVAVLAHEVGHYKRHHIRRSLLLEILQTGVILYIFSLVVGAPELSSALGIAHPVFHAGMLAFGILFSPVSTLTGIVMNIFSRRNEYEADAFAVSHADGAALASALIKLSVKNLSNLRPHPACVFVYFSHPTLLQRLHRINNPTKNTAK